MAKFIHCTKADSSEDTTDTTLSIAVAHVVAYHGAWDDTDMFLHCAILTSSGHTFLVRDLPDDIDEKIEKALAPTISA